VDHLRGLKENVTMGRLIPAGTGFEWSRHVRIPADEPPPPPALPQPAEDDFDLDREIEYAFESDESLGVRGGDTE
jgi:DNA-directed RNA polymerase subunit beta'